MPTRDPHEVLGVRRDAPEDEVRRAYRRLAREHHPDARPDDPASEDRFKEIQAAYEILSDAKKRREYDEGSRRSARRSTRTAGASHQRPASSVDLSDLLSRFGARTGDRREVNRQLNGEDLARIARVLGLDLSRISKLLGDSVKVNANVRFGGRRAGGSGTTGRRGPPKKPPKPPKTGEPDDA